MWRSASEPASGARRGFTLIEVVIGLVVAALLGVGLVRFYNDSYRTFSMQEQIEERNQNAHFLINKFVELLQQAGSSLPDTGWTVMTFPMGSLFNIGINPRGAVQFNGVDVSGTYFVPVGDASLFANTGNTMLNTTHVLIDYADPTKATQKIAIDAAYNSSGFVNGIKDNPADMDSVRLVSPVDLAVGDRIYGYREDQYVLTGGNLVIRPNGSAANQMVAAENVDSVGITFRDGAGAATTNWTLMRSATITVRARTAKPDPHLPPPGYRMISLPMNVILRNRI